MGRFLPSLDLEASVSRRSSMSLTELRNFSTEISAKLTFPLYQQGTLPEGRDTDRPRPGPADHAL